MRFDDLLITAAYFSIPIQLLVALHNYPRKLSNEIVSLLVLFALFIFLCGTGHLVRCMGLETSVFFGVLNGCTAGVSLITAAYLLPLCPSLLSQLEQELRDSESKRKLSTFMSFLCHEIRNPLFALMSSVEVLGDATATSDRGSTEMALASISDSANLMLRLVTDVLDIAKIEAGRLALESIDFDLHRLFESLANSMEHQCKDKHGDKVKIYLTIDSSVPRMVCADSTRILQCVHNLLSNALKFTEKGRIDLKVGTCSLEETMDQGCSNVYSDNDREFSMSLLEVEEGRCCNNMVLRIEATDTGCGIPKSKIETIFQPYSQSKLSDYRKHGGTGLGLSIISGIVRAMGGNISVTSEVDKGTSFVVCIPMKISKEPPSTVKISSDGSMDTISSPGNSSSDPSVLEPLNLDPNDNVVLVVDDNMVNQKIIGNMLTQFGIEYRVASDGREAADLLIERSRNHKNPDDATLPLYRLVFMDSCMPIMDGCDSIQEIRKHDIQVPIIALTANAVSTERERAMEVGATGFQTKPILRKDLYKLCRRYLMETEV